MLLALAVALVAQDPNVARIALKGVHDQGLHEVRVWIDVGDGVRLRSRWTDSSGAGYSLDAPLKAADWERLKPVVDASVNLRSARQLVSHAVDWSIAMTVGGEVREFTVRGEVEDERYSKLIDALIGARDRCLAFAKRAETEWPMPARRMLLPSVARAAAKALLASPTLDEVLLEGSFVNVEIVDAMIALLDRGDPGWAAAACAALSWISDRPACDDPEPWKAWWKDARAAWSPRVDIAGTGDVDRGRVRALAGGVAGFSDIELAPDGGVWALADEVYCYDAASDSWKASGALPRVETSYEPENRLHFLRRLGQSGIRFDRLHGGLGVSGDGARGIAVIGREGKRFAITDLAIFHFEKRDWRTIRTPLSVSDPVFNEEGSIAAVAASDGGWAAPNRVALYETATGRALGSPDIPPAETLFPIGSGNGCFYFFRNEVEGREDFEIWRHDVAPKKSERLMSESACSQYSLGVRTVIPITSDGAAILVRRATRRGASILGLLDVRTREFRAVSADGASAHRYAMSADATRVLFVRDGIAFEWRRK